MGSLKLVWQATMHLLAGHGRGIEVRRDGSPKDESWYGIQKMMSDPSFLDSMLDLPSIIEQGKLSARRLHACRTILQDVRGDTEFEQIDGLRNASIFTAALLGYVYA